MFSTSINFSFLYLSQFDIILINLLMVKFVQSMILANYEVLMIFQYYRIARNKQVLFYFLKKLNIE